jgi:PAS domain S-box-containing protein
MTDEEKTKEQLILELNELRRRLAVLSSPDSTPDRDDDTTEIRIAAVKIAEHNSYEKAFLVSEERFRAFAKSTFEGIAFTQKGYIVEANKQFAQIFGYEPEEVLGKRLKQFLAPEEHQRAWRLFRPDKEYVGEYRGVKKDGTIIIFEAHGWSMEQEGRLLCLSSIRDITERKRMEQALRESEERFRLATESLSGLVYEANLLDGRVRRWSGLFELLGYRVDEVPDSAEWWWERVHPGDMHQVKQKRSTAVAARSHIFSAEYRIRHRDGQWRWVMDNCRIIYDQDGNAARLVGCTINVDDRKTAQESLRESEFRYRRLFESDIIGIVYADENWILDTNDAFLKMIGYTRDDLKVSRIGW